MTGADCGVLGSRAVASIATDRCPDRPTFACQVGRSILARVSPFVSFLTFCSKFGMVQQAVTVQGDRNLIVVFRSAKECRFAERIATLGSPQLTSPATHATCIVPKTPVEGACKMSIKQIRLSGQAREQMIRLKTRTGIPHWNVLCRSAFCLSLLSGLASGPDGDIGRQQCGDDLAGLRRRCS